MICENIYYFHINKPYKRYGHTPNSDPDGYWHREMYKITFGTVINELATIIKDASQSELNLN